MTHPCPSGRRRTGAGTPGSASQQTDFGSVLLEGDRAEVHGLRSGKFNGKLVVLGKYVPGGGAEAAPRFEVPELGVRVRPANLRPMCDVEKRHSLSFGMAGPRPSMVGGEAVRLVPLGAGGGDQERV